ncbi:type VI secretion system Vgr family protein [Paracoccus pacificus]|uniref:Type VI secretion system Vgr family protein n=1 Tax=Paracoccus pacificus TaxID=1463598 RepID=A0ABW4R6K4_9RHOB
MNAPFKQVERLGRLTTQLGPDVLALLRFDGSDHLNDLFEYRVEALAATDDLDFDALIGTHATVEIEAHQVMRPFDGIVTSARWAGVGENGHRYDLTLRPWFWLAGQRRNQRIFHNMTVVQILQELLGEYAGLGQPAFEFKLTKDYPTLEYTVQYRESNLNFARRQMERHGISFYFRHANGSHTMVLTDDVLSHDSIGARPFKRFEGHHHYDQEHFWDWAPERNITTGAIRLTDYNFKKPDQAMEADHLGDAAYDNGKIESFDYPGDYPALDQGNLVSRLRAAGERGGDRRNRAVGDCVSLTAGTRLTLTGDKVPGSGESYICLSASHHFVSEAYGSGGMGSDGYAYSGSYVLMPDTAPMVPPRRTDIPVVNGPQTAMVVGEGEIDCDDYGRILVRFHWDLQGAHSMRCRVSQNWAGGGWGGIVIPRIGMEVVVEFLEGDPDKPLVTGCVYNGRNGVPYGLPGNKTRSTFRTNTHDGNQTGKGFNELRFEDQAGGEEIFMHAQKDMNIEVLNDRAKEVGHNQQEVVKNDKSIEVGGDHDEVVAGNVSIAVGKNPLSDLLRSKSKLLFDALGSAMGKLKLPDPFNFAKGNYQLFIEKNRSEVVGIGSSELVGAAKSVIVGHTYQTTVGKSHSLIVRGRADTDIGRIHNIRVGEQLTIKVGKNSMLSMSKEGEIIIEGKHIRLKAPKISQN